MKKFKKAIIPLILAAAMLSACGGGGEGTAEPSEGQGLTSPSPTVAATRAPATPTPAPTPRPAPGEMKDPTISVALPEGALIKDLYAA
jgi:ABC-type glycerol-3-phosphate transport system substrate-binding protein